MPCVSGSTARWLQECPLGQFLEGLLELGLGVHHNRAGALGFKAFLRRAGI